MIGFDDGTNGGTSLVFGQGLTRCSPASRFERFAWGVLLFNLLVIVWGAYVRASGSGAGCGSHWPLCNGRIIPDSSQIPTWIEFTHRLSSGICLILSGLLAFGARRVFPARHPARSAAGFSLLFIFLEAAIGAALVLLGQVAMDSSAGRAVTISLHLTNTLLLLGSLVLTARWSSPSRQAFRQSFRPPFPFWMIGAIVGTLLLGVTGAVTALGDTLYHSSSLAAGMREDFRPGSSFLLRLRIFHPLLAVGMGLVLCILAEICKSLAGSREADRLAKTLQLIVGAQLLLGALNLGLMAPVPLQLTHLFVADLLWITLVCLFSATQEGRGGHRELRVPLNDGVLPSLRR